MITIRTYQDLVNIGDNEIKRKEFVRNLINEHKASTVYKDAKDAYEYFKHRNVTILEYQKILYMVTGQAVPDNYSANFKMACRHFHRFITQEVQHLLGNGVTWENEGTEDALGKGKFSFDRQLVKAAKAALWGGVSFGFFNNDHIDVFDLLEFAPLYDEYDGSLKAGVRFWQIDDGKPLRATLYEIDGYTKYLWTVDDDAPITDEEKQSYIKGVTYTEADGYEIYDKDNYPTFPIVPLWGNSEHQSELIGLREQIDCYDLIKSGFANTVDEASIVYWTLQNAGGMNDVDLAKFVKHMKTVHAAVVDEDEGHAESHVLEAPYASREALLNRLDADLYRDAMALDTSRIASGATTATQIRAAYEDLTAKCDDFEYQILDFINGILEVADIDDEASFTRSMIVNQEELISTILQSAQYLSEDYVTEKILTILGDADRVEDTLADRDEDQFSRFNAQEEEPTEENTDEEPTEEELETEGGMDETA